ncbi:MAG TPA: FkbM family methyltransferase [Bacteroidia bacterium]|nr:FkbM family methyltransferase [Bacteroidia bacterium]
MMPFSEKIKLNLFKIIGKAYKKRLFRGTYNNAELRLLSRILEQRKLFFIDVGANKGEFIYVAENVLPARKICAFEPLPYFSEKLKVLFKDIQVFNFALSDKSSATTLYVPVKNDIPDDSLSSVNQPETGDYITYDINLKTLDEVTQEKNLNEAAFLKIDVEGHEFSVLKGGEQFIKNFVQIMLVEIEERHHKGKTLTEMIIEIENSGFVCYYLHPQKQQLMRFSENPEIYQKKEDLNTAKYINNFWFFAKQIQPESVVASLNQSIF